MRSSYGRVILHSGGVSEEEFGRAVRELALLKRAVAETIYTFQSPRKWVRALTGVEE